MMPEWALQNMAQPQRNPQAGERVSLRKTYTPPVRGKADDNSAQTSEPNKVKTPATTHTESTPGILGTCRLISEGWTKIEAPMMIPTTIAVAWRRPMGRSSGGRVGGVAKMGQFTTGVLAGMGTLPRQALPATLEGNWARALYDFHLRAQEPACSQDWQPHRIRSS